MHGSQDAFLLVSSSSFHCDIVSNDLAFSLNKIVLPNAFRLLLFELLLNRLGQALNSRSFVAISSMPLWASPMESVSFEFCILLSFLTLCLALAEDLSLLSSFRDFFFFDLFFLPSLEESSETLEESVLVSYRNLVAAEESE